MAAVFTAWIIEWDLAKGCGWIESEDSNAVAPKRTILFAVAASFES